MLCPLAILALTVLQTPSHDSETRVGEPDTPIRVQVDDKVAMPQVTSVSARTSAAGVAGVVIPGAETVVLVRYQDRLPFGLSEIGVGWTWNTRATISLGNTQAEVGISVIVDGSSGSVVAVYSDPAATWVLPVKTALDIEGIAAQDGWVMGAESPDSMESSAIDAIEEAWRQFGFDPRYVGQIIARPRWISAKYPARNVEGVLIPLRPTEKVWIVQVCGTRLHAERLFDGKLEYDTGEIMQFKDGSLEYIRGIFVP